MEKLDYRSPSLLSAQESAPLRFMKSLILNVGSASTIAVVWLLQATPLNAFLLGSLALIFSVAGGVYADDLVLGGTRVRWSEQLLLAGSVLLAFLSIVSISVSCS